MRRPVIAMLCAVAILSGLRAVTAADDQPPAATPEWPAALDFKMKTLDGEEVHLAEKYAGQVVLLVNVASRCGFTKQYEGLQMLHEKYAEQGLAIVAVPCNQFGGQEPGTAEQIAEFCDSKFGVEFDMLEKVNVRRNEDDQCPLYKYLTDKKHLPGIGSDINWNFEKFLIGRNGVPVAHYRSKVAPESEELIEAIEKALAVKVDAAGADSDSTKSAQSE